MFSTSLVGTRASFICRLWLSPHGCLYVSSSPCLSPHLLYLHYSLPLSLCLSTFLLIYFLSLHLALSEVHPHPQQALFDPVPTPIGTTGPGGVGWDVWEVFNSNMEFLEARSRLGLNMGESQLMGRVIVSVFFLEGRKAGGSAWQPLGGRGTCPDCTDRPHTWAQARPPMSNACLEVRQPAQSPEPKGEALHLYIRWLTCPQNTLAHPHPKSRSELPIPLPNPVWRHAASIDPASLVSISVSLSFSINFGP